MPATFIEKINRRAIRIASGRDRIRPGQAVRISEAAAPNDCVRQGDLYIVVVEAVPDGYRQAGKPNVQLVPGNTEGAKHCLDSLAAVDVFLPPQWGPESLQGPCVAAKSDVTILHPKHGHVTVPGGMLVRCDYQREFDAELRRERRNAD